MYNCPLCGSKLKLVKAFPGNYRKKRVERYACTCGHEESHESAFNENLADNRDAEIKAEDNKNKYKARFLDGDK